MIRLSRRAKSTRTEGRREREKEWNNQCACGKKRDAEKIATNHINISS